MPSSERTPLLSGSVNGPGLPSRRDIENALPSKESRIKVSQVLGALDAGKFPSQEQISKMLQLVIESDTLKAAGGAASRTARLGPEGHRVLENFKQVLRAFKAWGEEKNGDDLIQNFFYNATNADVDVDVNLPNAPSKKELSKDAQRAISSFRTIASLMVTNENFRQLVSDGIILSRDILADTAAEAADRAKKVADKSRPSEEERQKGVDFEHLGKKGKETAKHVASGKTKAEAKESLWEEVEGVREYFDEKLPDADEAKDQVIQRLQKIVKQAQENPEYRRSLKALIGLFKKYAHKAEEALDEAKAKSNVDDEDEKVQQAGRDLKAFIEKLANKSLDDVISTAQAAAKDVRDNDKLSKYFEELENYVDRLLFDPGYVVSQKAYRKASSLYDDGQSLLRENDQWKKDAAALQKELEALADGIANDSATNRLVQSIENLGDSIATAGKVGFNALSVEGVGLYRDITDVLVPRLISLVKEIPVPRLEYKSEDFDLVIDDINLESTSFIPDSVRFVQHNDLRFTQGYATYASEYDATARLRVEGFHFQASNIAFWVNKKTGFMPFEDSGILDVQFGPKGISFDVELENADPDDRETFFTVKKVEVWMEGFDFQVSKNHKWFATWFAKPILRAFVKRNLTSALEVQIQEYLKTADFRLFALQQRAIAATNARPSPVNFVRAVFSDSIFPQSFGRSTTEVKPKGVVKYGRHGEYILHIGVDEDLFPNQPPAEISNKARLKLKAKAAQMKREAKRATGAADEFADGAKKQAKDVAGKAKQEANEMSARAREAKRREERTEGWRSDAFDV